jgi:hypothetical protein
VSRREHGVARCLAFDLARQRIEQHEGVDFVVEQLDAQRFALGLRRKDVDDIATHTIRTLREIELVALVLHVREPAQELALIDAIAAREVQHHRQIRFGIAQAVDRRDGRDDDRVPALEQRLRRRQAHLLDVLVDRGILLDVRVRRRHVRLGLVIVVVRHEVLDGVVREELLELAVELRRKGLVVRQHERRALHRLDDVSDGKSFATSRDAEQRLVRQPRFDPFDELRDRLGLIAGRVVLTRELKSGRGSGLAHVLKKPARASSRRAEVVRRRAKKAGKIRVDVETEGESP